VKAAVFHAFGQPLVVEDVSDPRPGTAQVVVQVARSGICASDLHATHDPAFHTRSGDVLGHEFAGTVIEVGAGIDDVRKGDRVAVLPLLGCGQCSPCLRGYPSHCDRFGLTAGGYAEYAVAHQRQCIRLPQTVSDEDGALVEPMAVGAHAAAVGEVSMGSRVLVIGAGPIGLAVTFWARRLGANRVVASAPSRRREQLALEMGATAFLALDECTPENFQTHLGGPPDIVFECVGVAEAIQSSFDYVAPRGAVVLVGLCTDNVLLDPFKAMHKEVRYLNSAFYSVREFQAAVDVFDAGVTDPRAMISERVGMDGFVDAFEGLRNRSSQCKILVVPH
jgi:(R,R)-butanediol dehydrogenase/meso-butanediol dehydrogenase/diacetyl reductase